MHLFLLFHRGSCTNTSMSTTLYWDPWAKRGTEKIGETFVTAQYDRGKLANFPKGKLANFPIAVIKVYSVLACKQNYTKKKH